MGKSDNAVMAKIRAMYGKRLRMEDYEALLQKKTVGEIAAYLKQETYYAPLLAEVNQDLIHRGQLEHLLQRRSADIFHSLKRYGYDDPFFWNMYLLRSEIGQLLLAIRLINAGEMSHYINSLPAYLAKYTSFDLFALAKAETYDHLLDLLAPTPYFNILGPFRPATALRQINITGCETALLTYYYSTLLKTVEDGSYSKNTRRALLQIIYEQIDLHNLPVIYRLKRFYGWPPERIEACLVQVPTRPFPRLYRRLLQADTQAFFSITSRLPLFRPCPLSGTPDSGYLGAYNYRVRQWSYHKMFRFATSPVVVVACYMGLLEIEINNLTNIIEGIRYGVSAKEILGLLAVR